MPNALCECPLAGYCHRHQMNKSQHQWEMCRGVAPTVDCGRKYWIAWEKGMLGATAPAEPVTSPATFCPPARGIGDRVASVITRVTAGIMTPCGGCKDRQAVLNHWLPGQIPPIEPTTLDAATRHLTCHIWPVKGYGAWQWNCDWLLKHADLFNGRRIVAIAVSPEADSPDMVRDYLKDFTKDFIIVRNNPVLREVESWVPMLSMLEPYQSSQDVTFSCHAKAVRHRIKESESAGSTLFRWTRLMYQTCLDWPAVRPLLEQHGTVGSFRRFAAHMQSRTGFGPWHYSGSFFWWRNRDAFRRNWRYVPSKFFGTEAWPGIMFTPEESGVLFANDCGDLYVDEEMKKWEAEYAKRETPADVTARRVEAGNVQIRSHADDPDVRGEDVGGQPGQESPGTLPASLVDHD